MSNKIFIDWIRFSDLLKRILNNDSQVHDLVDPSEDTLPPPSLELIDFSLQVPGKT